MYKISLIFCSLLFSVFMSGCATYSYDDYRDELNSYYSPREEDIDIPDYPTNGAFLYKYRDPKTGVNYIVYRSTYGGGITPRYNPDGSLYVTDKDGNLISD